MEVVAPTVIAGLVSIAVTLVGVYAARRKGLPAINAEIEGRNSALIDTLREQVDALKGDFESCRGKLQEALVDNRSLSRRLRQAETDLIELFRATGKRPPDHLTGDDA